MKDIDFDELDKAVSSLMAATPKKPDDVNDVPADNLLELTAPAPSPASDVTQSPAQPVQRVQVRRSGRFMDMVAAPATGAKPSVMATRREGVSVEPVAAEGPVTKNDDVAPTDASVAPTTSAQTVQGTDTVPTETPAVPVVPTVASEPAESPFIADAKVEKRPLNAGPSSAPEDSSDDVIAPAGSIVNGSSDEPPALPEVPELDSDLVAIESGDEPDNGADIPAVDPKTSQTPVSEPAIPLGSTSIAPQYTPQASTGDQSHAAIYDAAHYPEPLSHPAKKRSGWLWVLGIILLLGVGAGGALALYSLGIIT